MWEGIVLAVATSLVITRTRKSSARLRYNIFGSLLALFICGVMFTFIIQLADANANATSGVSYHPANSVSFHKFVPPPATTSIGTPPAFMRLSDRFNQFAVQWGPLLTGLWVAFFAFKCSRLAAGFYHIRKLRRTGTSTPPVEWVVRTRQMAVSLGIGKAVILLESTLAKVPMVLGFLKPVIIVPIGMLAQLPPYQVETILVHELGHIRRNDYLVNLIQHFAEAIFFFNPAILWLSALLRKERECCCDDLVLAHERDPRSYVDTLVNFQEYQAAFAMPLGGNPLLARIQRIMLRENTPLNGAEKILLVLGILIVPAFGFMVKKEMSVKKPVSAAKVSASKIMNPGMEATDMGQVALHKIPTNAGFGSATRNSAQEVHKAPASASVKDTLPAIGDSIGEKDTIGGMVMPHGPMDFVTITRRDRSDADGSATYFEATDDAGKKYLITKHNHQLVALTINGEVIPEGKLERYAELADFLEGAQRVHESNIPKEWVEEWLKFGRINAHFDYEMKKNNENIKDPYETLKRAHELGNEHDSAITRVMIEYRRKRRQADPLADVSSRIVDIISDLRKEKLFTLHSDTVIVLDQTGLYLNGKKQADDIFTPFKTKYLHKPGDHYKYVDSAGMIQTWQ
jgi:beta-lactamase regulating signal transducer with metallopeptidase domain